jgi:predicted ATPase
MPAAAALPGTYQRPGGEPRRASASKEELLGRYPAPELTSEQRRQRTLEALVSQMEPLTGQNPLLMIFEDAHWTDPMTLELFGRVVDRIRTLRELLLVTFRSEFQAPWVGRPYVTALTINRLTERDIGAMIDRVVGNKLAPGELRQDIIERTDGIPLFIEEITKGGPFDQNHPRHWRSRGATVLSGALRSGHRGASMRIASWHRPLATGFRRR